MGKNSEKQKFETRSSYDLYFIIDFILTIIATLTTIMAIFVGLPFYIALPIAAWFFYTLLIKYFIYGFHRYIYKIEFDDEKEEIIFYYRLWGLFKTDKYILPNSALKIIYSDDISKSVFIKDMRKGRRGVFVGALAKYYIIGKKHWYRELWDNVVAKLEQVAKEKGHGTSFAIIPK